MNRLKLAQKRNYFKFVVSGMVKPESLFELTEEERVTYNKIIELQKELLNNFNSNSIKLGLNVTPKCFCGKTGKYVPEYADKDWYKNRNYSGLVCKKHKVLEWT